MSPFYEIYTNGMNFGTVKVLLQGGVRQWEWGCKKDEINVSWSNLDLRLQWPLLGD